MNSTGKKIKIIFSEKCLNYGNGNIESPTRVKMTYDFLKEKKYEFLEPTPASEKDLLRVQSKKWPDRRS